MRVSLCMLLYVLKKGLKMEMVLYPTIIDYDSQLDYFVIIIIKNQN